MLALFSPSLNEMFEMAEYGQVCMCCMDLSCIASKFHAQAVPDVRNCQFSECPDAVIIFYVHELSFGGDLGNI